ncbi:Rqc2 family fibronectin-binding protein [Stomatobaculum longum]|jgi:predicted RNA-binding protein homologous to eukaryotic snRNP|uniref:Rqc2 family fibronectin-binding protein n=1 Tax=Stomatobaculum longum TaxID=796942 RepID=UPI0028EF1440|nr:NFACT RNA binding domain-containing protein [Stomatobaculum longum]
MALDGIVIAALVKELRDTLLGGHIQKIAMPEKNELLLTVKNHAAQHRLLISCEASLPLLYLQAENKPSPLTAPGFAMLLRKHIGSGKITAVEQLGLERIVRIETTQLNELGDIAPRALYTELMGKYSNIIFTDENDVILDSMRRVPASVSSLREVLPGRPYFVPEKLQKTNPLELSETDFTAALTAQGSLPLDRALSSAFSGISSLIAQEVLFRTSLEPREVFDGLSAEKRNALYSVFSSLMEAVRTERFEPVMYLRDEVPVEFSALPLETLKAEGLEARRYTSVSELLYSYYALRAESSRMRQKSSDLRRLVQNHLERSQRKRILQEKQLADSQKKEKYRIYGDLLNSYAYQIPAGADHYVAENFYDENRPLRIPLDKNLSPAENAKKYFDRYAKLKRTELAVGAELEKTVQEEAHLASVLTALELATEESDLAEIREELAAFQYVKRQRAQKGKRPQKIQSHPLHFRSSDGFDIFVGKNNYQNEELTFKVASGSDWWFHAKGMPGSHVIVKANGQELPDRCFEEAAALAAYYSKGRDQDKVEIDYLQRRNVKKVNGAPPGFVIYHSNWSMMAKPRAEI